MQIIYWDQIFYAYASSIRLMVEVPPSAFCRGDMELDSWERFKEQ